MEKNELINVLNAKGFSASFAGTLLVVTVNNRKDVPCVVQTKVKYSKSLPVFIKFNNSDIEPIYYGSVLAIAKIISKYDCGANMVCCWKADKKIDYEELEKFLRELHNH